MSFCLIQRKAKRDLLVDCSQFLRKKKIPDPLLRQSAKLSGCDGIASCVIPIIAYALSDPQLYCGNWLYPMLQ